MSLFKFTHYEVQYIAQVLRVIKISQIQYVTACNLQGEMGLIIELGKVEIIYNDIIANDRYTKGDSHDRNDPMIVLSVLTIKLTRV